MSRNRAPSKSTLLVLSELCLQPQYGYALMKQTGLKSGTLYPILMRLTDRGLLTASWEDSPSPGRPPRQCYQLTPEGRAYANDALRADQVSPKSQNSVKGITT